MYDALRGQIGIIQFDVNVDVGRYAHVHPAIPTH